MPFSVSSTTLLIQGTLLANYSTRIILHSRKMLDDILIILSIFFPTEKKLVAQNMLNLYRRSCLPWKKRIHI